MPPPDHRFDGDYRTSREPGTRRVRVRFGTGGLEIEAGDGAPPKLWPYASLASNATVPIKGGDRVVLISSADADATLVVEDPQFTRSVLQSAPQLGSRRAIAPAWMGLAVASLAMIAVTGLLVWALFAMFPYKLVARQIPEETRAKIGQLALAEIARGHKRCESTAGISALNKLVDRLAKASATDIKFKVQVVDWSLINAFAVMGNQIVLTRGLLRIAASADEVAGVLGHEMGHAIEVHPEAAVLRALGTVIGIQVLVGGWTPDLVTEAAAQLLLLRHSRANETEADEVALRLLKEARIASGPFAGFFDKLGKAERKGTAPEAKLPDILATHPPTPERAQRVRAQPAYPATFALEAGDWDALRKICG